jgi:hypothetical protein
LGNGISGPEAATNPVSYLFCPANKWLDGRVQDHEADDAQNFRPESSSWGRQKNQMVNLATRIKKPSIK